MLYLVWRNGCYHGIWPAVRIKQQGTGALLSKLRIKHSYLLLVLLKKNSESEMYRFREKKEMSSLENRLLWTFS